MVKPFLSNLETVHLEAYELFQHHAYPAECAYARMYNQGDEPLGVPTIFHCYSKGGGFCSSD